MTNRWTAWTLAALALAVSTSEGTACEKAKAPAALKDTAATTAKTQGTGCDMPCCAHATPGADEKVAAVEKAAANGTMAAQAPADKPCAGHGSKGCAKRATATAAVVPNVEPATEVVKAETAPDPGTHR